MKLCIISDTHGYHRDIAIPDCDILVHCGDSTNTGELWEMRAFIDWLGQRRAKHIVFINGNHELTVSKFGNYTKQMVNDFNKYHFTNIHYLEESGVEINGVKFWGSPKTPEFFDWAYMYRRENGAKQWEGVPEGTDVLITHGPPAGIMDAVQPWGQYDRLQAGCDDLLAKVKEIKPKLHCFGHIHSTYGWLRPANPNLNQTLFVNAATCDSAYKPVHKAIVVDTKTWAVI